MGNIAEYLRTLRTAIFGKDVRESIAKSIEQTYEDATKNGNANMEVVDARGYYNSLKNRLDGDKNDLQTQVNSLSNSYLYKEIEIHKFLYEPTNTHYWIAKVPYRDEEGRIIEMQHGFANDEVSQNCVANETPRSFAKRHNATLCVNASIWGIDSEYENYKHIVGPIIHDGQIISEYGTDGYVNINQINVLAFDRERNFKVYPVSTSASTILLDGYTETIVAFDELVSNGEIINNGSSLYQWNIIAFNENTKDLYFCCCNGKNINDEEGMSLQTLLNILVNDYNCTFAYRLDQGGSTSLIKDNIMLNQPTDDYGLTERMTADYLYFSKELEIDTDKSINEITSILSDIEISEKKNNIGAKRIRNYFSSRPTTANLSPDGLGGLKVFQATSAMEEGKPPSDAHIIHLGWDNTNGFDGQIALRSDSDNLQMWMRSQREGNWGEWERLLNENDLIPYKEKMNNIQVINLGQLVIINIFGTFSVSTDSGTANVIGSLPEGLRPSMNVVGTPVVAKTTPGYTYCPNCYIQVRNNGSIEFYQNSGSRQDIIQIIGSIIYSTDWEV